MGVGSAYAAGFNSTRKQQRSFMPAVNSLSAIIANRKKRGGSIRVGRSDSGPSAEERADEFFGRIEAREEKEYQRSKADEAQRKEEEKEARAVGLMEAEEARRKEAHEAQMAQQQQTQAQGAETFERKNQVADRAQAYEMVKQGLMMRDSKTVNAALQQMVPEGYRGEDVITEGERIDGARSFKGRPPGANQTPQFVFDPDSDVVGVTFPGQEKPTVFKNAEQAFQNVLAPMNPAHEKSKDQIAEAKNKGELQFKNRKLDSENHWQAHEAAMKQFEYDGWYQPSAYNQEKYEAKYADSMARLTGKHPGEIEPPPQPTDEEKAAKAPSKRTPRGREKYQGDKPPPQFPNAQQDEDGTWFIMKGNKKYPIIKKKGKGKKKGQMQSAGVGLPSPKGDIGITGDRFSSKSQPRGVVSKKPRGKTVRKKMPSRITAGEGWSD
jgi:hypothetical protein